MVLLSCLSSSQLCVSLRIDRSRLPFSTLCNNPMSPRYLSAIKSKNTKFFGHPAAGKEVNHRMGWDFLGRRGSATFSRPNLGRNSLTRKSSAVYASCTGLPSSQIASSAFTWGTVAVLPFYTFMVVAPQAELTKKVAASSLPYVILGILYAFLLYLSWTPDTIRLMFASKYWLPELPGIAMMFSSDMTLASAWIHLLAVDLFAARQVYFEGLQDNIETRHSISLCLLFCPVGILAHIITKALITRPRKTEQHGMD